MLPLKEGLPRPLCFAPSGKEFKVLKVSGESSIAHHLASLGIVSDSKITVLSQEGSGTVILVKESRLALNRDVARHILVA